MNPETVLNMFRETGALLEGHFIYTSGRHGRQFIQAARVMQYPDKAEALGQALADLFREERPELVVGPATGGIVLAHVTARCFGCRAVYSEKDGQGGMAIKRGFAVPSGVRTLVVEDITTTGGSVRKTIEHLQARGAEVVGVGALIDRSGGVVAFDCPFRPLVTLKMESYLPDELPEDLRTVPAVEPDDIILG